jgi:hypothetical protein
MIDVRQRLPLPSGASETYYSLLHLENRGSVFFVLTRQSKQPICRRA